MRKFGLSEEDDVEVDLSDTMSVVNKYIDSMELENNIKSKVKEYINSLQIQAINQGTRNEL
jgi:hypothetical protein